MNNVNVIELMIHSARLLRNEEDPIGERSLMNAIDPVSTLLSSSENAVKLIRNLVSSGQIDERYGMYADDLDKAVAATKGESRE